jgi:hypothetical protein
MLKKLAYLFLPFVVACSNQAIFEQDKTSNKENAATLIVYTPNTAFNRQNFIKPSIFIDGKKLGKVSVDETLSALITPGVHQIAFQRSFPLMPIYEAAQIKIDMQANKTYYIRYSYDFDDYVQTNDTPKSTGASSFRWVNSEKGENKQ